MSLHWNSSSPLPVALEGRIAEQTPFPVSPSSVSQKPLTTTQILFYHLPKNYLVPLSLSPTSCHHLKQLSLFKPLNSQFRALRVSARSKAKRMKYKCSSRLITIAILSEVEAQVPETTDIKNYSSSSSACITLAAKTLQVNSQEEREDTH